MSALNLLHSGAVVYRSIVGRMGSSVRCGVLLIAGALMVSSCGGGGSSNNPINTAPTASGQSVVTTVGVGLAITLSGSDAEGDTLNFTVMVNPVNGALSGTAPNLTYTPNPLFRRVRQFHIYR